MRNRDPPKPSLPWQEGVDDWQIALTPSFAVNDDVALSGNMSYEDFAERLSAFGA